MKAWRIPAFGIENLSLDTLPDPHPGSGEVLVQIAAVSLNYRDLMTVEGHYNPKLKPGRIPCSDGAGVVLEVGPGVTCFRAGDRVAGIFMQRWIDGPPSAEKQKSALGGDVDGTLAQLRVFPEAGLVSVPHHLSLEEASTLPCAGVTAWNAVVHAGRVKAGDTVVIQGTGGVSIFALQFARLMGARVVGTSSSDEKLQRAAELGLAAGLNYKKVKDWATWVLEQTDGGGADLVVEVGGSGSFEQSLRATRINGTIAQIGVLSQTEKPLDVRSILIRSLRVQGIYVGSRAHFLEMNRALTESRIKPIVDRVFAFTEARQALQFMKRGSHFGKIVIAVNAQP